MEILELTQGTKEWKNARLNYFTASEAAAMLGISPYMTRTELLEMKATGIEKEVSPQLQKIFDRGHEVEAMARPIIEESLGEELYPIVGCIEIDDLKLMASFDGLTMLNDIVFEHKLLNAELTHNMAQGIIPEQYHPQLEQQLLVSGAEKAFFVASDGTEEHIESVTYTSNPELRKRIIDGWKKLKLDIANYKPREIKEKPEAEAIMQLPTLAVQIKGEVTLSNLPEFKVAAEQFIANINTDLKTDEDFANAEATVKFCSKAEKELEQVKKSAIAQTSSIDELMRTIDYIAEELRGKRLTLNKLVKSQKEAIKTSIIHDSNKAFYAHIAELEKTITPVKLTSATGPDFIGALKNKRTLASLHDAADTELARAEIEINQIHERIKLNLEYLESTAPKFKFLFNDIQAIAFKDSDDFSALVSMRINEHKAAEQKRLDAERERIREEEQRKIEAEKQKAIEEQRKAEAAEIAKAQDRAKQAASEQDDKEKLVSQAFQDVEKEQARLKGNSETITITVEEYDRLKHDSALLNELISGGVDNWEGWGFAIKSLEAG